jgi:beta-lactam-binding protein with PASTA domain
MNRRLVVLTVAALTVAVVGLTVALIVVASDSGGDSATSTTPSSLVPTVIGKDEAKAKTVLRGAGFEVASRSVPKNLVGLDAPRGVVLQQDPPAGSAAEPGSTVTLTVSARS